MDYIAANSGEDDQAAGLVRPSCVQESQILLPTLAKIQTHLSESMIDNPPDLRQAWELYRNKKEPHIQ